MIIFVVVFSILFVQKYFEVQLLSIFNVDDYVFTWCNTKHQCTITIHPCVKFILSKAMYVMCFG